MKRSKFDQFEPLPGVLWPSKYRNSEDSLLDVPPEKRYGEKETSLQSFGLSTMLSQTDSFTQLNKGKTRTVLLWSVNPESFFGDFKFLRGIAKRQETQNPNLVFLAFCFKLEVVHIRGS